MANIFDLLLHGTLADVQVWRLPNIKGQGEERWRGSRNTARLEGAIQKYDLVGYGTFFCVSTIATGQPRKKEHARELIWLFADFDFKDIEATPEEVERAVMGLELVPSRVHHTGGGLHAFWLLTVPFLSDGMDRAEELLRLIARRLGSDPQVAHRVALLRVPGSHNSKRVGPGQGRGELVRVLRDGMERYSPEQMDAWLTSLGAPVLRRRPRPGQAQNPFVLYGDELKGPMDVDAELAAMVQGNVHDTQLRAIASLQNAGVDEDDAVAHVLEATRALPHAAGWNWDQEELELRGMYRDAVKKFRAEAKAVPAQQAQAQVASVVSLDDARKSRDPDPEERKERVAEKISKKLKNEHVVIGGQILRVLSDQGQALLYSDKRMWLYKDGLWTAKDADEEKAFLSVMVEQACTASKLVSNTRLVNEVRAWIQRQPDLNREVEWDAHGLINTRSGLLDWRTDEVVPPTREHHATSRIECDYDPTATCPIWTSALRDDYQLDDDTIRFLQELAGANLVTKKPRTLTRALVLVGGSNTAKSTIIDVLAGLIAEEANATELKTIENAHGLMSFLRPVPWVLHEAFDQSRWEMSATTKALLSGDVVHVNVKNGPMISINFNQPIYWGSNVPPQFREASRAMETRLAIVQMNRIFDPFNPIGKAREAVARGYNKISLQILAEEKSGVLNWAIEGLKRVWQRGHFIFTNQMTASLHRMRVDSNMATGFVEQCCEFDENAFINTGDFYGAFTIWHNDHRGGATPSVDSLGRAMSNIGDARIGSKRINRQRTYTGIKLNEEGLDCWQAFSAHGAERTGLRISNAAEEVNRVLTPNMRTE